jgi:uracil-DNA glycosylase family 4
MTPLQQRVSDHAFSLGLSYDVLGSGSPTSQIAIIAEYPGETEVALKQPLVGGSGRYLWTELGKIGIRREQCYVTNVIKRRVITDHKEKLSVPVEEQRKWGAVLAQELSALSNVKYLLLLGNAALTAVTGHKGVKKWRGSVLSFTKEMGFGSTGHLLISYNPAYVMRDPTVETHFKIDMARFKRVLNGTYKPHAIHAHINPTKSQAIEYVRGLRAAGLPVSFDIETISKETACIGFANSAHEGMCINFRSHDSPSRFDISDEMAIRLAIAELFADSKLEFIAQNGNFDSYWLRYKDRIKASVHYDTLLAHHTLYPTLPHSLAFLTTAYTEHPYYKDEKDSWKDVGSIDQYWEYNVKDCCITRAAYTGTMAELQQQNLYTFFKSHVMKLQPHLVEMTVNGIMIDQTLRGSIAEELTKQLDDLESAVVSRARLATSDPTLEINPRSATQLRSLFFDKLKLVGRGTSTDEENRKRFRVHPNTSTASKELLDALDKYKEEHKFYSTYVDTLVDADGRIRCEWKQFGTQSAPGRLSSSAVMWGSGTNLQNQPDRARPMFIAPPGYGLVYFDLSQAEAQYVGVAWNIAGFLRNFEKARERPDLYDFHRLNAVDIFKVPYEQVPKEDFIDNKPTLRYKAKRCVHGLNYRMAPDKFATVTGLTVSEATLAHRLYHSAYPEIARAWHDLVARVRRGEALYNAFGRRWILLSRLDSDEALDSIVAFEPQSTIGDKVCQVIYQAHEDAEWPRSSRGLEAAVTLNIHDALIAVARLEDCNRVGRILHKYATTPIIVRNTELIIPAEVAISEPDERGIHRWSTLKKRKLSELT